MVDKTHNLNLIPILIQKAALPLALFLEDVCESFSVDVADLLKAYQKNQNTRFNINDYNGYPRTRLIGLDLAELTKIFQYSLDYHADIVTWLSADYEELKKYIKAVRDLRNSASHTSTYSNDSRIIYDELCTLSNLYSSVLYAAVRKDKSIFRLQTVHEMKLYDSEIQSELGNQASRHSPRRKIFWALLGISAFVLIIYLADQPSIDHDVVLIANEYIPIARAEEIQAYLATNQLRGETHFRVNVCTPDDGNNRVSTVVEVDSIAAFLNSASMSARKNVSLSQFTLAFKKCAKIISEDVEHGVRPQLLVLGSVTNPTERERTLLSTQLYTRPSVTAYWVAHKLPSPVFIRWAKPSESDSIIEYGFARRTVTLAPVVKIVR